MSAPRVYVVWTHPLFLEAVHRVLDQSNMESIGSTADRAAALEEIGRLRPDAVLMEEGETPDEDTAKFLGAMAPGTGLLGLNMEDNTLNVYHRRSQTVANVEDLLQFLRNE